MSQPSQGDFTQLLQLAQGGDDTAENELFEMIDEELRRIAVSLKRKAGLSPDSGSSLVNDAYVYLFARVKEQKNLDLKNRKYFFTAIANRMRNILIDRYKKRRPGPWDPVLNDVLEDFVRVTDWDFEVLHEVLNEFLQSEDPKQRRRHQLINLHFFCGMTYKAAAAELGMSASQYQIDRDRALAELQQAISRRKP